MRSASWSPDAVQGALPGPRAQRRPWKGSATALEATLLPGTGGPGDERRARVAPRAAYSAEPGAARAPYWTAIQVMSVASPVFMTIR